MASANNTIGAASTTSKHILNDMPAEIRNKIWEEVVKGDGGPVHMSRPDWYHAENSLRLNATLACKQVYEEAHTMYFAQNAFLFRLDDHKQPIYRFVEPVANWLYNISEVERACVERAVVCTKKHRLVVTFCWDLAVGIGMDFDFVVGKEIEGALEGHHCDRNHYEIVPKRLA